MDQEWWLPFGGVPAVMMATLHSAKVMMPRLDVHYADDIDDRSANTALKQLTSHPLPARSPLSGLCTLRRKASD